jgi:tetratricopeptide (TPR) repeat protein
MKYALCCAGLLVALSAFAQRDVDESHAHQHDPEKLGTVSFPTSCAPAVLKSFERGVALLHSFAYDKAEAQFTDIARQDPNCAMAHWGIAMRLQQLSDQPSAESFKRGHAEMLQALTLTSTPRERAYIDALVAFYQEDLQQDQNYAGQDVCWFSFPCVRARAFADGMAKVHRDYPNDVEGAAFYALSLLFSAPPNDTTFANAKEAIAILDPLLVRYPDHPGLAHYMIHACDTPQLAHLGLNAARAHAKIAPDSSHALHMPSHIFARLGMWQEDIQSNLASIAATRRTIAMHKGGEGDQVHATDFLVYALLQVGDDKSARARVEGVAKLVDEIRDSSQREDLIWADAHFPALFALETHHWADAASLASVPNAPPRVATETYWARTIGAARTGDAEGARKNADHYEALLEELGKTKESFLLQYFDVEHDEVLGWRDFAEKKNDDAIRRMRAVADRQDARGKGEVDLPAREMLADMLLELNRPQEALAEYERSMRIDPNRFNSLYSAGRAAELAHQPEKARSYYSTLLKNCEGSNSDRPELGRARATLEKKDSAAE